MLLACGHDILGLSRDKSSIEVADEHIMQNMRRFRNTAKPISGFWDIHVRDFGALELWLEGKDNIAVYICFIVNLCRLC